MNNERTPRWLFLHAVLVGILALISGRSFYLQVIRGSSWRATADNNHIAAATLPAPRGLIYDQAGVALVENISTTDLWLDPNNLPNQENEAYVIETLPTIVPQISSQDVHQTMQQARQGARLALLAKALDHDTVLKLEESNLGSQGVKLTSSLVRRYLFNQAMAHLLGYTSLAGTSDSTGKTGLEKYYQEQLTGRDGVAYTEVDASGQPQKDLGKQDPISGEDLRLTLDSELQNYIYQLLSEQGSPGAVVVLNPANGAIKALASYPSFNPNVFSQPALSSQSQEIIKHEGQPLFNRAIAGLYPPGSTIKPLLAAAGLQEKIITPTSTITSTGGLTIGPWFFPDWKVGGHGVTDVKKALAESVNTFFYLLAGGDDTHPGLGVKQATAYLKSFDWGKPTGIDLPEEAAGFLPSPEWKEQTKHESWYIGDTYHLGIGQGDVLVTPLQVAVATGALANGEYLYQPHLAADPKPTRHRLGIDRRYTQTVRQGMRQAVTEGSGRALSNVSIPLAGKTGTAQVGGSEETHAWFTSFGPYDKPTFVVTVLLERAGEGDDVAVPFAKNIWQWLIDYRLSEKNDNL